jgi:hypothetical protein
MPSSQLDPSLVKLYEELQLHSRFHGHQAEFDSVCWQHIHQHMSAKADWIPKLRQDTTRLGDQATTELDEPQYNDCSEMLDDIAHDLLLTHGKHFWPAWWNPPTDTPTLLPSGVLLHVDMNVSRDGDAILNKSVFRTTMNVSRLESHVGHNIRCYLVSLVKTSEKVPEKQPLKAMQLVQSLLDLSASQPAQLPHFGGGKRLTPFSDIVEDKDLGLEEGEIQEQPVRKRCRIVSVSVPKEVRSILSSAAQPTPGHLQTPRASREPSGYIEDSKFRQSRAQRSGSKHSPASEHQSCLTSTSESVETADDTDMQGTTREPPEPSVGSAAKDDFPSRIGPGMSAMTIGKYSCWLVTCRKRLNTLRQLVDHLENQQPIAYCDLIDIAAATPETAISQDTSATTYGKVHCWLHDCREKFATLKELHEHVRDQHPDEHSSFKDAAISSGIEPPQQLPPRPGIQSNVSTFETVTSEALQTMEAHDEKPIIIPYETEIAASEAPQAIETYDEMPSILACEALGDMQARKDASETFHNDYVADLRYYAGLPVVKR